MPYIDKVYFRSKSTQTIDDSELDVLIDYASDIIESMTMNLQGVSFGMLPSAVQEKVKKATVAQVDTLYLNGGIEDLSGGDFQSATIGKFSYGLGSRGTGQIESSIPISPMINIILGATGLLYRGLC